MKLVVADSGPLIVLARSGLLEVLRQVAGEVLVPATVFAECTGDVRKPGAHAILVARDAGLLSVHADVAATALGNIAALDAGELAALALALHLKQPVLMDERLGRQVAALHQIAVVGSAGVLLMAKRRGLIAAVGPVLASWQAMGYFLAPALLQAVLARAGESAGSV